MGKIAGPRQKPAAQRGKAKEVPAQAQKEKAAHGGAKQGKGRGKTPQVQSDQAAAAARKAESGRGRQARGKKQTLGTAPIAAAQQARAAKQAQVQEKAQAQKKGRGRQKKSKKPPIRAYFLGGLNEIGKNFTLYECQDDMVIVDCGMAFPDEEMLGVDLVIPDFTFVEKNRSKIRGVVITHGHEDHIGAVPYLLKKLNVPVYGTALTIGLIEGKLKEHGLTGSARLQVTPPGSHLQMGCMDVELIHVNHSIADAVALAIHSPAGTIVHTGDFKIDMTPAEGAMIDLARFAELGKEGVLALLADSTNAERPGYTKTEQSVHNSLDSLFLRAEGKRIIVATFASSISRVQMIIDCAVKYGRKVALSGRSMVNVMGIASELGYLHIPDGVLIDLNLINRYEPGQLVLITTGSQGEPMSALTRMAFSDHRQVAINPNDFIILSARPIPGNEKTVGAVVDELLKQGCTVIYESMYEVHVSGHACQEELKLMQALTRPKFFIPVHGEQKHLRKHAGLAMAMGIPEENIFIGHIGSVLEIQEDGIKQLADAPAGSVLVDGLGVGDVGSIVLRDRKHLAEDGIIVAVCTIEGDTGHVAAGPDIVSRGFVYVRESEALMDEARKVVYNTLEDCAKHRVRDWSALKQNVKDELSRFLYRKTQRSPMVLPIIMEV
ncbi:MAG TPA: ribonuclease J [Candidatus Acutalibacter stercorigallinarum]|nr:ribonuclease J [Candidatus Acutalibacter stercorigallinarum]